MLAGIRAEKLPAWAANRLRSSLNRCQMRPRIGRNYWRAQIEPLQLPSVLDVKAASALHQQFLDRRGTALQVDASGVERIGGLCLQVLLAARAAWANDRQALVFENPSPELRAGLDAFGVTPDALTYREG